jgi:membrane fusion protein, multidrug efflux system
MPGRIFLFSPLAGIFQLAGTDQMTTEETQNDRGILRYVVSGGILLATAITGLLVLRQINDNPRTDDAEIFANFIGIAPVVSGPITHLYVVDNQLVHTGDPLFIIDPRPYAYALEHARSDKTTLAGQIDDERRLIAARASAVDVAKASAASSEAALHHAEAAIAQAKAEIASSQATLDRAVAEQTYADNNLHRLEPLLERQFVTVDQVDQARTAAQTRAHATQQYRSQLALAQASLDAANAQYRQAQANMEASSHGVQQAAHSVTTLAPFTGQIGARQAAIDIAQYNFENTRVIAPFDARVTNLTISQGAFATAGQHVFTLIDTRTWWAIANFRETQLGHIHPGMKADVYTLSRPTTRFEGIVDSVGFGVTPDSELVGRLTQPGLPDVQRTLNWVHLASRFPVRVRIENPPPEIFRLGESAIVIIRGDSSVIPRPVPHH